MSDALGRLLTHPLRHRLLLEYSSGPEYPARLARRLGEPLNVVSYHTRVLARHGFIEPVRTERRRGGLTHYYRSVAAAVLDEEDWAALPDSLRRSLTVGTVVQAMEEARQAARHGGFDAPEMHLSRSPLELDDDGAEELARCLLDALEEITRIAAASRQRSPRRLPYEVVLLSFEARSSLPAREPADKPDFVPQG